MKPIRSPKNGSDIATNAAWTSQVSLVQVRSSAAPQGLNQHVSRSECRYAGLTSEDTIQRAVYKSDRKRSLDAAL